MRAGGVESRDQRQCLPLFRKGVDIARGGVEIDSELFEFGDVEVEFAEQVQCLDPRQRGDGGAEGPAGGHLVQPAIVEPVDVGRPIQVGEENRFEDGSPGGTPAISLAGKDEDLVIVQGQDRALGPGPIGNRSPR